MTEGARFVGAGLAFKLNHLFLREAPMSLEWAKSERVRPFVRPSVRPFVRPEVIENLRAAFGGWTHRIPYAAFDHLILKKILKIQK